ncbi:MAG: anthranilate phosphoribosyltransferase [Actinomycetaceae bacterium]|nr:anthranilate phosphoribosyltransferase [Actinomycetaceae bacterium]
MHERPQWPDLLTRVINGEDLERDEAAAAVNTIMDGEASPAILASFLTALAAKGETPTEIRGMAEAMLAHTLPVSVGDGALDIVGTGGDRMKTVNISTMASIVIAATGVPVVKHGNRASSSASGSADCLEALGLNLSQTAEGVERDFAELGIAFIFANVFHPAMRYVSPTRRELGIATAFNILGPLTNPARPSVSVIGVSRLDAAELVAGVLAERGSVGLVFRGKNGMDELSAVSINELWEVRDGAIERFDFDAVAELGLAKASVEDLHGDGPEYNAAVTREVLEGQRVGPVREAVLLNAAGALVAAGRHEGTRAADGTFGERIARAYAIAEEAVDSGKAIELLDRWVALSNS